MKLWQMLLRLLKNIAPSGARVVVDTNVLISGTIARQGASSRIVDAALDGEIRMIMSRMLLAEYLDVIHRRHIAKRYQDIAPRIQDICDFLQRKAIRVSGSFVESVLRDPDDDFLIACAIEGNAQYIVSGDEHLLELKQYRGIAILSPRDFVEQILG